MGFKSQIVAFYPYIYLLDWKTDPTDDVINDFGYGRGIWLRPELKNALVRIGKAGLNGGQKPYTLRLMWTYPNLMFMGVCEGRT